MVNVRNPSKGSKTNGGKGSISANLRKTKFMAIANNSTELFIKGKSNEIPILQNYKDEFKRGQKEDKIFYGMHMEKGHANAQVRTDGQSLVSAGRLSKLPDGKFETHKLRAVNINGLVAFYNPQLARQLIADEKDKKLKELYQANYKFLEELPRRDSYYD